MKRFYKEEIAQWVVRQLEVSNFVVSDVLPCFSDVEAAGCEHEAIVTRGGPDSVTLEVFAWVNTMVGNVKNSMHGSYHTI